MGSTDISLSSYMFFNCCFRSSYLIIFSVYARWMLSSRGTLMSIIIAFFSVSFSSSIITVSALLWSNLLMKIDVFNHKATQTRLKITHGAIIFIPLICLGL
uniref:Uncharacterized protein n=1 Tax=Cacopsylla melanoneura TaxID=428564 RepID=A0A8D8Y8G2_9HEMI